MIVNLLPGLLFITSIGFFIALALVVTSRKYPTDENEIVLQVNRLLPQTQCAQCGHPGCKPYAEAISRGDPINRCPPGGEQVIRDLANLLGREYLPLDESFGITQPERVAKIREDECIGCTLCIQACPVDAIIGASQQMHVVIEDQCTGCDLCLDPCPVDCIDMIDVLTLTTPLSIRALVPRRGKTTETSCIRCGECEISCPKQLAPQELFWQKSSSSAMQALNLDSCIECMICDRVCPSHIPLTNHFIATKQRLASELQIQQRASEAESRFDSRSQRQQLSQSRLRTRSNRKSRASILQRLKQSK